jgi:uncharacterized membrane protein
MHLLRAMILLLLAAGPAAASGPAPDPGARYRVTGVRADDVLNVRAQPAAAAPVVATLSPRARGVVVTGARTREGAQVWWEIVHASAPRGTGWINARFLAPEEPPAAADGDFTLRCVGAEPFWSLTIADGEARYTSPDDPDATMLAGSWIDAAARPRGYRFAVPLTHAGRTGFAVVARAENFCTDGMSDVDFPYAATVILPDRRVLEGCCARAR